MLDRITQEDRPTDAGALIPRATVEAIVAQRNAVLKLYGEAFDTLTVATAAVEKAGTAFNRIRAREGRFNYHSHDEKGKFLEALNLPKRQDYLATAQKLVDIEVWSHIIELTDLERLMDKEAKDKLHRDLTETPPEPTVENIRATLEQFAADADMIWRRGVANAFSKLDRRFRSHDGFKIGSRVILTYMFDEYGWRNFRSDQESTLMDIERAFLILDGVAVPPNYAGIVGRLRNSRGHGHGARQSYAENEFFRLKGFKNGNAHLYFQRDDLVEKVNKVLAEYYGETIGDGMTQDDGGLFTPKTSLAKNYGFFPTPEEPANRLIEGLPRGKAKNAPALTILEPSAGTGNLARLCARQVESYDSDTRTHFKHRAKVDCVEIQLELADKLRAEGIYRKVICCEFLAMKPDPANLYDRVAMNPPFDRERDIDHVIHALEFLKPDGCLVAIMSAGTEFRETRKSIAFRALMEKLNAKFEDLPAGSFASSGTYINTIMLRVWKDGRRQSWGWR